MKPETLPDRAFSALETFIDRAVGLFSPSTARDRLRTRGMLASSGAWYGGSRRRAAMKDWKPASDDVNTALLADLPLLRDRSHDLVRNNPLAGGAIETNVCHVVGTGLSLMAAIDHELLGMTEDEAEKWESDTERRFRAWFESRDCDLLRAQNGYGLQALAFRSMLESGDVLALMPIVDRPGIGPQLTVQLVEADRVCNPNNQADSVRLSGGVEMDEAGTPLRVHVCKQHPGDRRPGASVRSWSAVEMFSPSGRRRANLLFETRRPGQVRGIPYLANVMEPLRQLGRYSDAEIAAAVHSAVLAVFTKIDPQVFNELFADDPQAVDQLLRSKWDGSVPDPMDGSGAVKAVNLVPGESIEVPALGRPNAQFQPFVEAVFEQIGSGLSMPREVMMKTYKASYSAARAAILDAWRFVRVRREFMGDYFCQWVYETWMDWEVANGRISAPGYYAPGEDGRMIRAAWQGAVWIGDAPGAIDEGKAVAAAKERVELGISTLNSESVLYDGIPWRVKLRQRKREQEAMKKAGLAQDVAGQPMPGQTEVKPTAEAAPGV